MGLTSTPSPSAKPTAESPLVLNHAIATVAKTIDEQILALPGSRDRLLPAIKHAITYYEQVIAAIPGPIGVSTGRHNTEPVLAALFPAAEDITIGLGRSIAVRNSISWFVENGHDRVFAIMGTRIRPGSTAKGLTDHTFRSLAASEHDARECLREAAFTSLVNAFVTRLKERQREWRVLHADQQSDLAPTITPSAPGANPATAEITAEDSLEALINWLRAPEAQLRLSLRDGEVATVPDSSSNLTLPLMSSADRRHWLVCLAEFSAQEASGAIGQYPQANRYILI